MSKTGTERWRITANPCAWGNPEAEVLVLGFSKGPTQVGALARKTHDEIAFDRGRTNVRKILHALGLVRADTDMDRLIADRTGRFAFGSLIRCTVEQWNAEDNQWKSSGGDMLGGFVADPWGKRVVSNCTTRFLRDLPANTKLVALFGFGKEARRVGPFGREGAYVQEAERAIRAARLAGTWRRINEVAYTDDHVVFVHVEHFAAQGRLISDWLGNKRGNGSLADPKRVRWRDAAREAVRLAYPNGFLRS